MFKYRLKELVRRHLQVDDLFVLFVPLMSNSKYLEVIIILITKRTRVYINKKWKWIQNGLKDQVYRISWPSVSQGFKFSPYSNFAKRMYLFELCSLKISVFLFETSKLLNLQLTQKEVLHVLQTGYFFSSKFYLFIE